VENPKEFDKQMERRGEKYRSSDIVPLYNKIKKQKQAEQKKQEFFNVLNRAIAKKQDDKYDELLLNVAKEFKDLDKQIKQELDVLKKGCQEDLEKISKIIAEKPSFAESKELDYFIKSYENITNKIDDIKEKYINFYMRE